MFGRYVHLDNSRAIVSLRQIITYDEFIREGNPPDVHAGRKDKKPFVEYRKAEEEWHRRLTEIKREAGLY